MEIKWVFLNVVSLLFAFVVVAILVPVMHGWFKHRALPLKLLISGFMERILP